jgi:hypothetical protein
MQSAIILVFAYSIVFAIAPLLAEQRALCYLEDPDELVMARLLEQPDLPPTFVPDPTRGPVVTELSPNNLPLEYGVVAVGGSIHRVPARRILNSLKGTCCETGTTQVKITKAVNNLLHDTVNILSDLTWLQIINYSG